MSTDDSFAEVLEKLEKRIALHRENADNTKGRKPTIASRAPAEATARQGQPKGSRLEIQYVFSGA